MRRFRLPGALLVFAASFAIASGVLASAPLVTFGTAAVTVDGNSASIELASGGEFGGVYVRAQALGNKAVGNIQAGFTSTGDVAGGAPRLNLPIDNDGDKLFDYWVVLDAANCGGISGASTVVSTANPDCVVFFLGGEAPAASYPNWDAYVAANPTHQVASKGDNSTPFIIADGTAGTYEVEAIDLQ